MHFNYKDLAKAPRMAFSFKMIWIGIVGFLASWLVYNIFLFLASLFSGVSFLNMHYMIYSVQKVSLFSQFSVFGIILFIIGLISSICIMFLSYVAMARAAYMNLREELFYSWLDAYKWALKKWISIIGTYITFIILIAMFVIGAIVMSYIGKIPYIGSFITAVFSIPYILAGMLLVYIVIGFLVSLVYAPSIIATYDEDALGAVFQSFSSLASQPFRTFWYYFLTRFLNAFFSVLYVLGLLAGVIVFTKLFSVGMGQSMESLFKAGTLLALKILGGPVHIFLQNTWVSGIQEQTAFLPTLIFGISFFVLILSVPAYSMAVDISGFTISYVIIEKLKDDENLLERKDEEVDTEEEDEEDLEEEMEENEEENQDQDEAEKGGDEKEEN
jgi:hypothetical protein